MDQRSPWVEEHANPARPNDFTTVRLLGRPRLRVLAAAEVDGQLEVLVEIDHAVTGCRLSAYDSGCGAPEPARCWASTTPGLVGALAAARAGPGGDARTRG
jgi:hypothetical protein